MALHYRTEYGLGDRGRVCRSYTGFQAFVAIGFDLVFGLLFELVASTIGFAMSLLIFLPRLLARAFRLYWRIMVALMTLLVYLVTFPFALVHEAVDRLRSRSGDYAHDREPHAGDGIKTSWALSREV